MKAARKFHVVAPLGCQAREGGAQGLRRPFPVRRPKGSRERRHRRSPSVRSASPVGGCAAGTAADATGDAPRRSGAAVQRRVASDYLRGAENGTWRRDASAQADAPHPGGRSPRGSRRRAWARSPCRTQPGWRHPPHSVGARTSTTRRAASPRRRRCCSTTAAPRRWRWATGRASSTGSTWPTARSRPAGAAGTGSTVGSGQGCAIGNPGGGSPATGVNGIEVPGSPPIDSTASVNTNGDLYFGAGNAASPVDRRLLRLRVERGRGVEPGRAPTRPPTRRPTAASRRRSPSLTAGRSSRAARWGR